MKTLARWVRWITAALTLAAFVHTSNSAALTCAGTLDTTFTPPAEFGAWSTFEARGAQFTGSNVIVGPVLAWGADVAAHFTQPDGKVVVAGAIGSRLTNKRRLMLRLNPDGGTDPTFNPPLVGDGIIRAAKLVEGGKIVVGGWYESPEHSISGVFRLNSDGSLDSSFRSGREFDGSVTALAVLPDGKLTKCRGWSKVSAGRTTADS